MRPQTLPELGEAGFRDATRVALLLVHRGLQTRPDGMTRAEVDVYDLIESLDEQEAANVIAMLSGLAAQWFLVATPSPEAAGQSLQGLIEQFS